MPKEKIKDNLLYKEYIVIGSGLSGLSASKELSKNKKEHLIVTSNYEPSKVSKSDTFRNSIFKRKSVSPKIHIKRFQREMENWQNVYNIKHSSFNLIQILSNSVGGLSRYWGANLGHDYSEVIESNIENLIEVNRANLIRDDNKISMQSDLSEKILFSKSNEKSFINFHSPFLGIAIKNESQSICKKCGAYYCNCDGKLLQPYKFNNEKIIEFEVKKIKQDGNIFFLTGINHENRRETISCKYLIFACGPIISPLLVNMIKKIPNELNLNHNGLFSFPFLSFYKIKNKPLALSNLNLSIYSSKTAKYQKDPEAYANIFPLKPQLLIKYPFLNGISDKILNRLYYCVVYTDSTFVNSKLNIKESKVKGEYKKKFYFFSIFIYLRIILFLLRKAFCLPILFPIYSSPGTDIHYGSTLSNVDFGKNLNNKIFFYDSSTIKKISSINPTVRNLTLSKRKFRDWITNH
tara:strand:+ start:1007 stop:2395 length:1389 start_codon:yes stop_codon:yes gene_type:complete